MFTFGSVLKVVSYSDLFISVRLIQFSANADDLFFFFLLSHRMS